LKKKKLKNAVSDFLSFLSSDKTSQLRTKKSQLFSISAVLS